MGPVSSYLSWLNRAARKMTTHTHTHTNTHKHTQTHTNTHTTHTTHTTQNTQESSPCGFGGDGEMDGVCVAHEQEDLWQQQMRHVDVVDVNHLVTRLQLLARVSWGPLDNLNNENACQGKRNKRDKKRRKGDGTETNDNVDMHVSLQSSLATSRA